MHDRITKYVMNNNTGVRGELNIHSINTRGLRNKSKRDKMLNFIKNNYKGILFLQEVHITNTDKVTEWFPEWGEHIYCSYGTASSKGTVILIPSYIDIKITSINCDEEGRYVMLESHFEEQELVLLNYYAPTQDKKQEQMVYLEKVLNLIADKSHKLIWGGDFNMYLDPVKDRYKPQSGNMTDMVKRLSTIMEELNMCDLWRVFNPDILRYTWRGNSTIGIAQSRLDYWLTPISMMYLVKECEISPCILTDHSLITLKIQTPNRNQGGKGLWKFNVSLLNDREYLNRINLLLDECKTKYQTVTDPRLRWDVLQMEVRGFTILIRRFKHCSDDVKLKVFGSYCNSLYCAQL